MPSAINTRHILAGHGPRHVRATLSTAQVAQRIVASIKLHAAQGVVRQVTDYTDREETLEAVQELLKGEVTLA